MVTHRYRVSKYQLFQYTLRVPNPGGNVIVRCTEINVYLASCPDIHEPLPMIPISLDMS